MRLSWDRKVTLNDDLNQEKISHKATKAQRKMKVKKYR
jgi:hypothetical protein